MTGYLSRRLLALVPVLVGITIISFAVMQLAPGKPTDAAMQFNPKASLEARARMEHLLGLDQPLHLQYLTWLRRVARFDFGRSFRDGRPVTEKILERLPITVTINLCALLVIFAIAVWTLHATGLTRKYARFTLIFGGFLMYALGFLLIFAPEVLTFG